MYDELGEEMLQHSDLRERLVAALDGPAPWLLWDVPRALARNLLHKLDNPPQPERLVYGWRRAMLDATEAIAEAWAGESNKQAAASSLRGNRAEDPSVCFATVRAV